MKNQSNVMSRREFLKKTGLGALALVLFGKFEVGNVEAATVSDNLSGGGSHIGETPPSNVKMTWIDTGNDGVMKYYDGSQWTPIRSTWDE